MHTCSVKLVIVAIEIMVIQSIYLNIGRVSADKASIGKLFHSGMVTCVKEYFTMGKRNSVVMDNISSIW